MSITLSHTYLLAITLLLLSACQSNETDKGGYLFNKIPPTTSGVTFNNQITETDDFNILNFHYIYNGGGVGVGDFDKNGLPDLVFSGNQVASEIYLNQGELNFTNITKTSNFDTKGWATGVSIIDINGDGWQDIYLSVGGLNCIDNCKNQLFINQGLNEQGVPLFVERAAAYGLSDGQYTQQAAFFDYDLDGDLDVYLLHNVIDNRDKNAPSLPKFINKKSTDKLLRNDGNQQFVEVSDSMGVVHRGYGLGVTINDFNLDGLPDIYVANDFLSSDLMYLHKGFKNGQMLGYKEVSKDKLKHQSYNSMGVDVADINNDALPDIFVLDMMPEYHERQKTMMGFMNYDKFQLSLRQGYAPQFIRNTLQVNNGVLNEKLMPFSEMGYLAGVYNTDWSWTPLLADFDNDGDRDIYVTNGYGKDITDLDFINYSNQASTFGTNESRQEILHEALQKMERIPMPNYIFENEGDLKFTNRSASWTRKENSISNGAIYSDLDNDGDLDLVVNNINETAFILENQINNKTKNHYFKIKLEDIAENPSSIGARVDLWTGGEQQTHFQSPVRGYLSTVDEVVHFGLGTNTLVDSLKIRWSNGQINTLQNLPVDTLFIWKSGIEEALNELKTVDNQLFKENKTIATYFGKHIENPFQDFDAQPLLLHQHSRQGPCIVSANVNGQTGDEVFIGGAKGEPSRIFFEKNDGTYEVQILNDKEIEATDAAFFDFDSDGDLDLYVVSGGTEFLADAKEYQDRFYLNDGQGNFTFSTTIKSPAKSSGSCVLPADFDQDGDIDLFVGARVVPKSYPSAPRSYLLINHEGKWLDYTNKLAYPLENIGMVSDAVWADYDKDGWEDLILVGEWMPITIFQNQKQGYFKKLESPSLANTTGLWNTIAAADIDADGDTDFMLGNLGQNTRLQASHTEPLTIYAADFDKNGSPDPLVGQYYLNKKGERKDYPIHARDDVVRQLVKIKGRYLTYADFSQATFTDLLQEPAKTGDLLSAKTLNTSYLENKGANNFELHPLAQATQIAPVQEILIDDFNQDGHVDALMVGNDYTAEKNGGWHDAFNGLYLQGEGDGSFTPIPLAKSGFLVGGDGRTITKVMNKNGVIRILVGQNSGDFKVFDIQNAKPVE